MNGSDTLKALCILISTWKCVSFSWKAQNKAKQTHSKKHAMLSRTYFWELKLATCYTEWLLRLQSLKNVFIQFVYCHTSPHLKTVAMWLFVTVNSSSQCIVQMWHRALFASVLPTKVQLCTVWKIQRSFFVRIEFISVHAKTWIFLPTICLCSPSFFSWETIHAPQFYI